MRQITVKLSIKERDYVDRLIEQNKFASYGHSFRALLHYYKVNTREIAKLRTRLAQFQERLRLYETGRLGQETLPTDMGNSGSTKRT